MAPCSVKVKNVKPTDALKLCLKTNAYIVEWGDLSIQSRYCPYLRENFNF